MKNCLCFYGGNFSSVFLAGLAGFIDFQETTGYTENMKNQRSGNNCAGVELADGKDDRYWKPGF